MSAVDIVHRHKKFEKDKSYMVSEEVRIFVPKTRWSFFVRGVPV